MTESLIILLHGVGSNGGDLMHLGDIWREMLPGATLAAPDAPFVFEGGRGRQWFSVAGVNAQNRGGRIVAVRAAFDATVQEAIDRHGFSQAPERVALAGFSQGAIMALAACRDRYLARHVVAIAGRCTPLPETWERRTAVTLVHGRMDRTVPVQHSERMFERLAALGADVRLDVVPRAVHLLVSPLLERAWEAVRATSR